MTRAFFTFLRLALLGPAVLLAQALPPTSPLPRLLAERRMLTQRYAEARAQRHGLLGLSHKPSKQDLQEVVTALQGIVDQDERIVAVLNQTTQQAQTTTATLQTTGRDDRNLTAQRLSELQNQLQNQQERLRQATERQRGIAAELREAQQSRLLRDALLAGLAVACVGLFFWRRKK
ncbi:hypothetical protein [Hymenobacter psoromatis]|uniref:hypothetical protein n=1 Tax=Hymenobacter psoromatis TaxID=1484116 RepID=UPI001CBDFC77|nr:hypothetical protein [Hymenobacter psoromatis]